jgi:hypothetical protein
MIASWTGQGTTCNISVGVGRWRNCRIFFFVTTIIDVLLMYYRRRRPSAAIGRQMPTLFEREAMTVNIGAPKSVCHMCHLFVTRSALGHRSLLSSVRFCVGLWTQHTHVSILNLWTLWRCSICEPRQLIPSLLTGQRHCIWFYSRLKFISLSLRSSCASENRRLSLRYVWGRKNIICSRKIGIPISPSICHVSNVL